jgi:hypothetical protein
MKKEFLFVFLAVGLFQVGIASGVVDAIQFGIAQGRRPYQEDRALLFYSSINRTLWGIIADGHAGANVAILVRNNIKSLIKKYFDYSASMTQDFFKENMEKIFSILYKKITSTKDCDGQGATLTVVGLGLDDNMRPLWVGCANVGDTEMRIIEPAQGLNVTSPVHNISAYHNNIMNCPEEKERVADLLNREEAYKYDELYWGVNIFIGAIQLTKSLEGKGWTTDIVSPIPSITYYNKFSDIDQDSLPDIWVFSDGFTDKIGKNNKLLHQVYTAEIAFTNLIDVQKNNGDNTTILHFNLKLLSQLKINAILKNITKINREMSKVFQEDEGKFIMTDEELNGVIIKNSVQAKNNHQMTKQLNTDQYKKTSPGVIKLLWQKLLNFFHNFIN